MSKRVYKKGGGHNFFTKHEEAAKLRSQNLKWDEVARRLNVSVNTLYDHVDKIRPLMDRTLKISRPRARPPAKRARRQAA